MPKINKNNIGVHFTSNSDEWTTPDEFFQRLDKWYNFTLDPCCRKETAKCAKFYTKEDDGLSKDWSNEVVFVNPPYSKGCQAKWIKKSYEESLKGATVVMLVPARPDTKAWFEYCSKATEIIFIVGRMKFVNGEKNNAPAPFPSCLVIFKKMKEKFPLCVHWKKQTDF